MAKSEKETNVDFQKGYLTKVSPLKISRTNNQYCNAVLETQHRNYSVVAFVPEKHQFCVEAAKMNSPVKISNFKFVKSRLSAESLDIQISKSTSMEMLKKIDFKKRLFQTETAPATESAPDVTMIDKVDSNTTSVMVSFLYDTGRLFYY